MVRGDCFAGVWVCGWPAESLQTSCDFRLNSCVCPEELSESQDVALTEGLGNPQPGQMEPLIYRSLSPRRTDLPEHILCAYMLIKVFCFGLFFPNCLKKGLCVCLTLLSFGTQGTNPVFCASSLSPFPCLGFIGAHSCPFPHLVARATLEVHL